MNGQKWILLGGGLLVVLISSSLLFLRPASVALPNGMKVRFEGVSYGTNAYMHGNALEKLLGRWIPADGLNLGGIKLRKPEPIYYSIPYRFLGLDPVLRQKPFGVLASKEISDPVLCFIMMTPADMAPSFVHDLNTCRVVAVSEDGTAFPNRFSGAIKRPNIKEIFVSASLNFFPRTEKKISFRLETKDKSGQWQSMANYSIINPAPLTNEAWNGVLSTLPQTNFVGDFGVILTEALVVDESSRSRKQLKKELMFRSTTVPFQGLSKTALSLGFTLKLKEGSQVDDLRWGRDWQILQCVTRDRFANELNWESANLKASLSQDQSFNLIAFGDALHNELRKVEVVLVPKGLALSPAAAVTFTNLAKPVGSEADAQEFCLTNALGVPILAKWSAKGLEIKLHEMAKEGWLATAKISCDGCSESIEKASRDEQQIIFNRIPGDRVKVEARAVGLVRLSFFIKPELPNELIDEE